MKKILLLIIFLLIINLSGCLSSVNYNLNITVHNKSDYNKNFTVVVQDSNSNEVFNNTFSLIPNQSEKILDITNENGIYTILFFINNNLTIEDNNIHIGKGYGPVEIYVYNDRSKLHQQQD